MGGASDDDILRAEQHLGRRLPDDFRSFVRQDDGHEGWFGEMYLMIFRTETIAELHPVHDDAVHMPGFVAFGSDGGGELFGFDFRQDPPVVVMVGNVSAGWHDAIVQAAS